MISEPLLSALTLLRMLWSPLSLNQPGPNRAHQANRGCATNRCVLALSAPSVAQAGPRPQRKTFQSIPSRSVSPPLSREAEREQGSAPPHRERLSANRGGPNTWLLCHAGPPR